MNHREPPQLSAGTRRALHCLSLLLLPALTPDGAHAWPRLRPQKPRPGIPADPTAYLPTAGAPPLRFQEAIPPPDLVTRPPAAAPPTPALSPTESSVALANAAAALPGIVDEAPTATAPAAAAASAPVPMPAAATTPTTPPAKTPPAILPDNARPPVRPEDFLPYFQIPGSAQTPAEVTLLIPAPKSPPAPNPLPPSSATYTQSNK